MPHLETICAPSTYYTPAELKDWMLRANVYGHVTRTQGKAILQKLLPMLPVTASLTVRTNKGMIYVEADNKLFRVDRLGAIINKPWNPNPRKPSRKAWVD